MLLIKPLAVAFAASLAGFPTFLAVRGGQTERETAFLDVKPHAARFRACGCRSGGAAEGACRTEFSMNSQFWLTPLAKI